MSPPPLPMSLVAHAQEIVRRLGGRISAEGGICRCPAHQDRTPSLSVRAGRTRLLLHCFAGCGAKEILGALASAGLLDPRMPAADAPSLVPRATSLADAARKLWGSARLIAGTPAERYLRGRGLESCSAELRFHPRTPDGPKPFTIFRPAMVAAVRDEGGLVGIHRTYLDPAHDKLAALEAPRAGLGRFGGGAVRLGGVAPRLGLAEGIETALSATALFGIPCWATLGTERFRHVTLPDMVEELLLFLDGDAGGRRAERLAREAHRERGLPIHARYPAAGEDWNDVLRAGRGMTGAVEAEERIALRG